MDKAFKRMERLSDYDFTSKSRNQIIKDLNLDSDHIKNLDECMFILKKNGVTGGFSLLEFLEEIDEPDAPAPPKGWKLLEED